ncbi:hypothetical protein [Microbacterium flavum]|uniref:hypothetical protein n=1 Tax=Microbacterium flavum TaxID=415216 RepID=UPI0024AD6A9D|nr:hypothetical protein [Microbacterium flavum]
MSDSEPDTPPLTPFLTAYVFEEVNPVLLGMDQETWVPNRQVNLARAVLGTLAPNPETVVLVVTGDIVQSARDRFPEAARAEAFDDERGAGTLGGKTMTVGAETHVLMPYWFYTDNDAVRDLMGDEEAEEWIAGSEAREKLAIRTAVHEAQHVIMKQAGEDENDFSDAWRARGMFLTLAHDIIDEYRAELGVATGMREDFESRIAPETLLAWRAALTGAASDYQKHRDVQRLMYGVLEQSQHAWKALANVAAARRVAGGSTPLDPTVPEWTALVSEHWENFEQMLNEVPPPHTRTSPVTMRAYAEELADILDSWLQALGFTWRDTHGGRNAEFLITSRHIIG